MEEYRETLEIIIETIFKSYMVILSIISIALIITILFRKKFNTKKIRALLSIVLVCVCLCASLVLVPRIIDLNQNNFVTITNGKLILDETNVIKNSGSIIFYGYADAFLKDGKSIKLVGINFFDSPSSKPNQEFYGDIVYCKYSKQLIAVE